MTTGICDADALRPLSRLIQGPIETRSDLLESETLLRTVLLHDVMFVAPTPLPYIGIERYVYIEKYGELLVPVAINPRLEGLTFIEDWSKCEIQPLDIAVELYHLAAKHAGRAKQIQIIRDRDYQQSAEIALVGLPKGDSAAAINYIGHVHAAFIGSIFSVVASGGSAVLASELGQAALSKAARYPLALFSELDTQWQAFARSLHEDGINFCVPPILSIVLSRCATRQAIPSVITDLREEWAGARRKIWMLLDALPRVRTLGEAIEIQRNLAEASQLFAPSPTEHDSRPVRVLWEILSASAAGAATALVSGGKPQIGLISGALAQVPRSIPGLLDDFGPAIFGRGAFDLARRIRRELSDVEINALSRLLTQTEIDMLAASSERIST